MESKTLNDVVESESDHDSSELVSSSPSEFEKNQKHYQEIIATLPHKDGWTRQDPFIEYGGHWWLEFILEGLLHAQRFFKARPSDFFVCSYPKTGTTWLKALTFAITNRSKFEDSTNPLLKRNPHEFVPYIEIDFPFFPSVGVLNDERNTLFSTHVPYDLLPESILKSDCKMVYIWRDPKDTFVSMWTFSYKERLQQGSVLISLEEAFDMYCQGLSAYGHYLDYVLGYWKAYEANPNQILFLKYETMRADTLPYVKRLAEFMGYGFTEEEEKEMVVEKVVKLCSFENLKNLEANKGEKDREDRPTVFANSAYFRKGKVGDWQNYLTPEMVARIDGLMEKKFKGTGLLSSTSSI
ncbi:Cytosolic sulfotransferase 17 [Cardamine amara subsp. amara]|uniref:Sulfotransferase n=1 Tax=Cardamine amara subsp. amara TaxID=228776 RepID=A0ABD0ZRR8_CARAN